MLRRTSDRLGWTGCTSFYKVYKETDVEEEAGHVGYILTCSAGREVERRNNRPLRDFTTDLSQQIDYKIYILAT